MSEFSDDISLFESQFLDPEVLELAHMIDAELEHEDTLLPADEALSLGYEVVGAVTESLERNPRSVYEQGYLVLRLEADLDGDIFESIDNLKHAKSVTAVAGPVPNTETSYYDESGPWSEVAVGIQSAAGIDKFFDISLGDSPLATVSRDGVYTTESRPIKNIEMTQLLAAVSAIEKSG